MGQNYYKSRQFQLLKIGAKLLQIGGVITNWGGIETFISSCIETSGNINIVLNNVPENAGDKPKQEKQDVAKSISVWIQLPLYKISPNQQLDSKIDLSKRKLFTEYYHNNKKFEILFLNNPECDRELSCISCKLFFPKNNPVVPDGELVIMHN